MASMRRSPLTGSKVARLAALLVVVSTIDCGAAPPRRETKGTTATYYYTEWGQLPPQTAFDVAPRPADGMAAFVSRIVYPVYERRRHIGERFMMVVAFDKTGRILSVKGLESKQPDLQRCVIKAIWATKWLPAMKNHKPVAATINFPVAFVPPR